MRAEGNKEPGCQSRLVSARVISCTQQSGTQYFALVIGNNDYKFIPHLATALSDAQEVARVLRTQYEFQVELLPNATREQILGALNKYRRSLPPEASLLIYYAGHGQNDKDVDKAYWLPVDARPDQNTNWISADDVTTDLKGIRARHILVVSDSCYSGGLSRGLSTLVQPSGDRSRFLDNWGARGPSRILLASGGNEPVADGGGVGQHSVFASALLKGLQNMEYPQFTVEELFLRVQESVGGRSDQVPQLSPIRNSGHDEGSFVFLRSAPAATGKEPIVPVTARELPDITDDDVRRALTFTKVNPKDGLTSRFYWPSDVYDGLLRWG